MAKADSKILDDIYTAWRFDNLDLLSSYLPIEFSHFINIPTELHPLGGLRSGKDNALRRLAGIFHEFKTERLDVRPLGSEGFKTTLDVDMLCLHRASGLHFEATKRNIWSLEAGWPISLAEYYDLPRFESFMQDVNRELASNPH